MSEIWQMKDASVFSLPSRLGSNLQQSDGFSHSHQNLFTLYTHKIGTYILYIHKEKDEYPLESTIDSISLETSNTPLETHMSSDLPETSLRVLVISSESKVRLSQIC